MTTKTMFFATLALMLSPSLALAAGPNKTVQSNGTHTSHSGQYPGRTPHTPTSHGATMPR